VSVLLPNTRLGVRRFEEAEADARGYRASTALGPLLGVGDGHAEELPDHSWRLRVDPGCWPINEKDVIEEEGTGRQWTATRVDLLKHSLDSTVDYVRVEARLREAGGTRPPDAPPRRVQAGRIL
jgi:hypothetical protein